MTNTQEACPYVLMDDASYIMDDPEACMGGPVTDETPLVVIKEYN